MAIIDLMMKLNLSFTDADRDACIPIISRIDDFSKAAHKDGFFALVDLIETEDNPFLKEAVMLVVDGCENPLLGELLAYMLIAEKDSSANMLCAFVIARGVMMIHNGDKPSKIKLELYSMLGAKYMAREREATDAKMAIHSLEQFYAQIAHYKSADIEGSPFASLIAESDKAALVDVCGQFETLLSNMSDESINAALKGVRTKTIEHAIRGLGFETIKRIMDNLPVERQAEIYSNWNFMGPIRISDIQDSVSELMTMWKSEIDLQPAHGQF